MERKTLIRVVLALAFVTVTARADRVQWSPAEGGNGHFYEAVHAPAGIFWSQAMAAAQAMGGHLATITSAEENAFVYHLITDSQYWNQNRWGPWLGGFQPKASAEPAGNWRWVTGEPFIYYTNWTPTQPDNLGHDESCLHFGAAYGKVKLSTWNDLPDEYTYAPIRGYIVEYEQPRIIYVDDDAAGANNGTSWADAYMYLQDALMMASSTDQIRVAQGIYRPDQFALSDRPNLGRAETFRLIDGVTIRGGFAGRGSPDPNARDIQRYETILSGDIAGDDNLGVSNWVENCRHVVTGSGTNETAVLDGFSIQSGYADGPDSEYPLINCGAGMYNENASPTIVNCTFTRNRAVLYDGEYGGLGAAMYNYRSNVTIKNCMFTGNSTSGWDATIHNQNSSPVIDDCLFERNKGCGISFYQQSRGCVRRCRFFRNGASYGAGINCEYDSGPVISDCVFVANAAGYDGGAVRCYENCNPRIVNCVFAGNRTSLQNGAGIVCLRSSPSVTNCTFTANRAKLDGGAVFCYRESNPTLTDCILWANTARNGSQIALAYYDLPGSEPAAAQISLSYCDIQGGLNDIYTNSEHCRVNWGNGNIDADPCFAEQGYWDPNSTPEDVNDDFWSNGDYHLKSQAGRWQPTEISNLKSQISSPPPGAWVQDTVTSPCIDAGDPASPIGPEPFPNGGRINMGAYGGTAEASKSYFGEPLCQTVVAGDLNGDCKVDFHDFAIMARHWLADYSL